MGAVLYLYIVHSIIFFSCEYFFFFRSYCSLVDSMWPLGILFAGLLSKKKGLFVLTSKQNMRVCLNDNRVNIISLTYTFADVNCLA